ncbi:hypothetical protein GGX14DRAFT_376242, partial [Mycena pura]
EPTSTSRQQGGSLDRVAELGTKALEMAQLLDKFKKVARYEDQNMKIVGIDGTIYLTIYFADDELAEGLTEGQPEVGDRPEVDRTLLRQMFLDLLKLGTVSLRSVSLNTSLTFPQMEPWPTIHFLNSLEPAIHDFVVGADRAWSRVRSTLSSAVPEYAGITYVGIFPADVKEKNYPDLVAFVKGGMAMVLGDNKGILVQTNGNDVVRVYASFRKPLATWLDEVGLNFLVGGGKHAEARELFLKQFEGWCPEATGYLKVPCLSMDVRPLYKFKNRHTWDTNPYATLLGDSAHVTVEFFNWHSSAQH